MGKTLHLVGEEVEYFRNKNKAKESAYGICLRVYSENFHQCFESHFETKSLENDKSKLTLEKSLFLLILRYDQKFFKLVIRIFNQLKSWCFSKCCNERRLKTHNTLPFDEKTLSETAQGVPPPWGYNLGSVFEKYEIHWKLWHSKKDL